jgi:hypothetical protein
MKKITLMLFILVVSYSVYSQIGIRAGINLASFSYSAPDETEDLFTFKSNLGFQAGIDYEMNLGGAIYFNPAVLYSQKGSKLEFDFLGAKSEGKFVHNYIEVPLDFVYKFGSDDMKFGVFAGPYLGYFLGGYTQGDGEDKETYDKADIDDGFNRIDYGVELGLGFYLSGINVRAYYSLGLANFGKVEEGDPDVVWKNKGIGLTVGYRL